MSTLRFQGVMPAITTPFTDSGAIDHDFLAKHANWMIDAGCTAIIGLGSLGEGATLESEEKIALLRTCVEALGDKAPVIASISALSTDAACRLAEASAKVGCQGLMVLPPYVHKGPDVEILGHYEAVSSATELPCLLYNNPIAYGFDLQPERVAELASRRPNIRGVKESSGDVRRVTAARALLGDDFELCAGLDDMAWEAGMCGARGWVAGLVNAFPAESVALFKAACEGRQEEAFAIYRWFLPLLRLDTVPEFVQLIKLVQAEVGMGSERCRAPRAPVQGALREHALAIIKAALAEGARPEVAA